MDQALLEVKNLYVEFATHGGSVRAVRGVDFALSRGQTLAIVGESGCGKSVTVQALMGLIPRPPGKVTQGSVLFEGREILGLPPHELNRVRGKEIGMIFQDPMTSLNPTMTLGRQIAETLRYHDGLSDHDASKRAIELFDQVRIPRAQSRIHEYPFQFSGGMRQRVMIAMAIACRPKILIADEPTTALDVTIQAQILGLLKNLQTELSMSIILITHDLGVVAHMADQVVVMYAGQVVESGSADQVFYNPTHPYTLGLRAAQPRAERTSNKVRLKPIEGSPPDLFAPPPGCAYASRCEQTMQVCLKVRPQIYSVSPGHGSRCWLHDERAPC